MPEAFNFSQGVLQEDGWLKDEQDEEWSSGRGATRSLPSCTHARAARTRLHFDGRAHQSNLQPTQTAALTKSSTKRPTTTPATLTTPTPTISTTLTPAVDNTIHLKKNTPLHHSEQAVT